MQHSTLRLAVLTLILGLLVACAAQAGYYDVVMDDTPVAYWRLNELSGTSVSDSAGTHTGTLYQPVTLGEPGPLMYDPDPAMDFGGGRVAVPYASDLDGTAFSIECWARADALGEDLYWRTPMMYRWVDPATSPAYKCYGYNLYADKDNDNWEFWIGRGPTTAGFAVLNGPVVEIGKWTHMVGTYDGTAMRFYVNGDLMGSSVQPYGVLPSGKATFNIGTGASPWLGGLDEMAVYNYALSAEQVEQHYLTGIPEPASLTLLLGGLALLRTRRRRR
jgi:hypothetical protein